MKYTNYLFISTLAVLSIITSNIAIAESGIPVGDNKITTTTPAVGYVYACEVPKGGGGADASGGWLRNGLWYPSEKPTVDGAVKWPNASAKFSVKSEHRTIQSNSLPINHTTGIYPISSSDDAYQYDKNPNTIQAQTVSLTLPLNPKIATQPSCVPMGMIGVTTSGVALFNALDGEGRDAAAYEIQDSCGGHPERSGEYHYHNMSKCLNKKSGTKQVLVGYALDGFGIYTGYDSAGKKLSNRDLDECHGTKSKVKWNGKTVSIYHYVMTDEYPYSIGCFKGTPVQTSQATSGPTMQNTSGMNQNQQGIKSSQNGSEPKPPAGAITACATKSKGATCSVGPMQGTCNTRANVIACIPTQK